MLAGAAAGFGLNAQASGGAAAQLIGAARLTVWGFEVYNARLLAAPGFQRDRYAQHPFTLELAYLRSFDGSDIAQRSLKEMQRVDDFSDAQAQKWLAEMTRLFPDVKRGDRLAGIYTPGTGVRFVFNDKPLGEVRDADFARVFMGIWLSPKTSEPAMREQLLAGAAP
ncbi:MAG: chalcone isomerase family protein [Ramlibacter sp.]|jgi:hypothetical protein